MRHHRSSSISLFVLALTASLASTIACSSGATSGAIGDAGSGSTTPDAAASSGDENDGASKVSARPDAGAKVDANTGPVNTPLLELTFDGANVSPTKTEIEKHGIQGRTDAKGMVRAKLELPLGPNDDTAPYITIDVYTPLQGHADYFDAANPEQPHIADVVYHYQRPMLSGFPEAVGPGMEILRDGRDGWFEATCDGTFTIDHKDHAFTLSIRQQVAALP